MEAPPSSSMPLPADTSPPDAASADADQEPSLEEMLKRPPNYVPLPKWDDPQLRHMPKGSDEGQPPVSPEEAWRKINTLVEKYDKGMCESYREQIDTLLVFAGLFSAVVTAFAVESYKWLQDDPAETSAELMRQAVSLLSALAKQSIPAASPRSPSLPDAVVVRINVYWFMSLVLSLSAALVGIVCKQWLREYERDVSQSAKQALGVRQMKFEGLEYWRVGPIVTAVPLLLQVALALFLIGISELLWHLHRTVAISVTSLAGLTAAFYLVTALLPLLQYFYLSIRSDRGFEPLRNRATISAFTAPQCPYKSPQGWLILRLFLPIIHYARDYLTVHDLGSWISFDTDWARRRDSVISVMTTTFRALGWADRSLGESHLSAWIFLCAREEGRILSRNGERTARVHRKLELLRYSYHKALDFNMSVELLLHLINDDLAPIGPKDLSNHLQHIWTQFRNLNLDYDLALELVRSLEEVLSSKREHPEISSVSSLLENTVRVVRQAPTGGVTLVPALCALLLRWLQTFPSSQYDADWQRAAAADNVLSQVAKGVDINGNIEVRESRSFCHIAALARFMLETDPSLITRRYDLGGTLDRLGLGSLYQNRPHSAHKLHTHEGTLSYWEDFEAGSADAPATHPITEPETRSSLVGHRDSSSEVSLAVTPPTPPARCHGHATTLPPVVAPGDLSPVETSVFTPPAHTEIYTRETTPDAADVTFAPPAPITQRHSETLLAPGDESPVDTRKPLPPPHPAIAIEMRKIGASPDA